MATTPAPTKQKFELVDGSFFEFETFEVDKARYLYCYLPPLKPTGRARTQSEYIYVTKEDYAIVQRDKYKNPITDAEQKKMRIGILSNTTNHPFPKGIYIPFRLDRWGSCEHALGDVYGDFVFSNEK